MERRQELIKPPLEVLIRRFGFGGLQLFLGREQSRGRERVRTPESSANKKLLARSLYV